MDEKPRISGDLQLPLDAYQAAQPNVALPPARRRLSRRSLLKAAGVLGVGLGVGAAGRLTYLLARDQTLFTYRGHKYGIEALAWSPDSRWIASAGGDVHLWEALSGRLIHVFPDREGVESLAWSPDGKYIAIGSWDNTASVWEVANFHKILTYSGHDRRQNAASFSTLALAGKQSSMTFPFLSLRPPGIESLVWSPDGTRLLSCGGDNTTQMWEALTGKLLLIFGSRLDYYYAGAWFPDGQRILMRTERGIQVHEASLGALLFTIAVGNEDFDGSSSFSLDGRLLATTDSETRTTHFWDAMTGRQVRTYTEVDSFDAWSPDSKCFATTDDDLRINIWDAASGKTEYTFWGHMNIFQKFFSEPLFSGFASSVQRAHLASAALLQSASPLLPQDRYPPPSSVDALAWSPDGRYIASGGTDATVQVWQPG